jgi:hypothetical protein
METYYFHIRDHLGRIDDHDGIALPSFMAMLVEAVRSADEFAREVELHRDIRFEIEDMHGRTVFVTPVRERWESWDFLARLSQPRSIGN